jgi:hypothetical protein
MCNNNRNTKPKVLIVDDVVENLHAVKTIPRVEFALIAARAVKYG